MIDWNSSSSEVLVNPRIPLDSKDVLMRALDNYNHQNHLNGHIWIATSGSSDYPKWIALKKQSILASAESVCRHLNSTHKDVWLNALPIFHVGGLSILARCFVSGASLIPYVFKEHKWNPSQYVEQLHSCKATLSSIVPTQVFDIVTLKLVPPNSLRAVIVGGGVLNPELYFKAIELGWKLLPSYGLTECSSQVATASLDSLVENVYPGMKPLDHVTIAVNTEGFLKINSPALLTGYLEIMKGETTLIDPKNNGWFTTKDIAELKDEEIISIRRSDSFIKIAGESFDLRFLERVLASIILSSDSTFDAALFVLPDPRLGHAIHLAVDQAHCSLLNDVVNQFNNRVLPLARIKQVHEVSAIPRSSLNKLLKKELIDLISL